MNKTDFDPITRLPVIAHVIDEMLDKAQSQASALTRATHLSMVLKKNQTKLVKSQYRMQLDDIHQFSNLLAHWHKEPTEDKNGQDIERASEQLVKLNYAINTVLLMLSKAPTS